MGLAIHPQNDVGDSFACRPSHACPSFQVTAFEYLHHFHFQRRHTLYSRQFFLGWSQFLLRYAVFCHYCCGSENRRILAFLRQSRESFARATACSCSSTCVVTATCPLECLAGRVHVWAGLDHPNILRAVGVCQGADKSSLEYVLFEQPLDSLTRCLATLPQLLTPPQFLRLTRQVLAGLVRIHSLGWAHGCVALDAIWVFETDDALIAKIGPGVLGAFKPGGISDDIAAFGMLVADIMRVYVVGMPAPFSTESVAARSSHGLGDCLLVLEPIVSVIQRCVQPLDAKHARPSAAELLSIWDAALDKVALPVVHTRSVDDMD